jgi:hypothetical protein
MYTMRCDSMPRPKPKGPIKHFQLRLKPEEAERWQRVFDKARDRNPRINETEVNRRLLGLDSDIDGAVTEKDRIYFLGQTGATELVGQTKPSKAHLKEVSPRSKRH